MWLTGLLPCLFNYVFYTAKDHILRVTPPTVAGLLASIINPTDFPMCQSGGGIFPDVLGFCEVEGKQNNRPAHYTRGSLPIQLDMGEIIFSPGENVMQPNRKVFFKILRD